MTTSVKNNFLPSSVISNLQQVLISTNGSLEDTSNNESVASSTSSSLSSSPSICDTSSVKKDCENPVVLLTNGEGIDSPGLISLVQALVLDGSFNVHVCAPQLDRSVSGHSVTIRETLVACSVEMSGATAYELSGSPADCVSLALSGPLFSGSKPLLVVSGINIGSSCGHNMFYSGAVAAAREALICGVPSLCISLNWKKGVSSEKDLKDACTSVCLPLLFAALRDIKKGIFPQNCSLNIKVPTHPLANKGFKVTRQSLWRSSLSWQAVSANSHPSGSHFMSNQQSLGITLAQLSRDASAAGAARRLNSHRKNVEIESTGVGVAGKVNNQHTMKKYFRLELSEDKQETTEEDVDFRAVEDGFVAVTPICLTVQPEVHASVSNWVADALASER